MGRKMSDDPLPVDPASAWWTINGECIRDALQRVAAGEHPEIVWLEMVADCEVDGGATDGG
jgi:hypothetical protein